MRTRAKTSRKLGSTCQEGRLRSRQNVSMGMCREEKKSMRWSRNVSTRSGMEWKGHVKRIYIYIHTHTHTHTYIYSYIHMKDFSPV
jgi:hypothetical protein